MWKGEETGTGGAAGVHIYKDLNALHLKYAQSLGIAPLKGKNIREQAEKLVDKGKLEEIEYWIERGVVQDALAGVAGGRVDYARSLMDHLCHWLVSLGANGSPAPGNTERANLADVVSLAMKRRDLAALADGTETPEAPGGRINRRF